VTLTEKNFLAEQFEAHRGRLKSVAYRMLGSHAEAEDAVQEAWLRLHRSDPESIYNIGGWLTTVVARLCLDMLRARKSSREEPLEILGSEGGYSVPTADSGNASPEDEIAMADSVGLAMLAVLETLTPRERVAFVLHDMFAVPFDDIAPILGSSPEATRQLASRARRRVRGAQTDRKVDNARRREIIDAFLAAARGGDFEALLTLLDPEVVMRGDAAAARLAGRAEARGAKDVAGFFKGGAQAARPALVDGRVDIAVLPASKLLVILQLEIVGGRITTIDAVADKAAMERFNLEVLED
jgi:RNA polymerase sigma-70 factor, ECF subfamily